MNNELLTAFRSEVQLPSHATARRVFGQAIRRRPRRVTRTRVVIAVAVVVAVAVGAGLSTTLGGASPDKDIAARQQVVDRAVKHVQDAFGDRRITSAELYGGVLSVKLAASNPPATVIGGFEARILANVVDEDLRAGPVRDRRMQSKGDGGAVYGEGVRLPTAAPPLPGGACEVAPGAVPAHSTVRSARVVPLLGGFCAFELETSDPTAFGAAAPVTVSKLPEMTSRRPHLIEVYDDTKRLQIIQWSSPFTGAEPGDSGPLGNGEGGSWAHPPLCDPFASGGPGVCG